MNSISDRESKKEQRTFAICIIAALTLLLDFIGAFNSYTVFIIYFCFIFILAGVLPKIVKFLMALDYKQKNIKIDTSISGKEKDLKDTKDTLKTLGFLAIVFSLFSGKRKK